MKQWSEIPHRDREHVLLRLLATVNGLEQTLALAQDTKMLDAAQQLEAEIAAWYAALGALSDAGEDTPLTTKNGCVRTAEK